MGNVVQVKRSIDFTAFVDRSYITRLCEEIQSSLREHREKSMFTFLYRYFQTFIQQERLEELEMFIDIIEVYPFASNADRVLTFTGYMRALLRKREEKLKEAAYWFRFTLARQKLLQEIGLSNIAVDCHKQLGNLEFDRKAYNYAFEHYQAAVNLLSLDKDCEYLLAKLMYKHALCQYCLKNYQQALEYLDKVIPLAKDTSNSLLLLNAFIMKAVLLSEHFMKYEESNRYLIDAFDLAKRNKHLKVIPKIWSISAHNFYRLEQKVLAEHALRSAINCCGEAGDWKGQIEAELLQAKIWMEQGQQQRAKELLEIVMANVADNPDYVKAYLSCLELLQQLEEDEILRSQYVKKALQLATANNNYRKTKKFEKILIDMSRSGNNR